MVMVVMMMVMKMVKTIVMMMVDGNGSDDDDGGDDDAIGVEKGVASCDKVTARSCRDGESRQRWRIADSKAWLIVVEEASSVKSGKSS